MEQLENIYPTERKVLFGDQTVVIKTFVVDDIPIVARILERILDTSKEKSIDKDSIVSLIISSFSVHYEDIITLLSTSTSLEKEFLKKINIAAITFLLKHIVEENTEFFQGQMLPIIKEMMSGLEGAGSQEKPMVGAK